MIRNRMHTFTTSGNVFSRNQTRVIKCQLYYILPLNRAIGKFSISIGGTCTKFCPPSVSLTFREIYRGNGSRGKAHGNGEVISFELKPDYWCKVTRQFLPSSLRMELINSAQGFRYNAILTKQEMNLTVLEQICRSLSQISINKIHVIIFVAVAFSAITLPGQISN